MEVKKLDADQNKMQEDSYFLMSEMVGDQIKHKALNDDLQKI